MQQAPEPPEDSKLVRTKRQWARDGRLLTGTTADPARDRLPPGQRLVQDWPVLDLGAQPEVTPRRFRLDVDGAVRRPLSLSRSRFMALPQAESMSDIHCVTQWSRYDNAWRGVASARTLLAMVEPVTRRATSCCMGSTATRPISGSTSSTRRTCCWRMSWQGRPLTAEHGGPVRVVIPRLYFWKSAKWIRRIEITAADRPGVLGAQRLPQQRRSLGGGALWLS